MADINMFADLADRPAAATGRSGGARSRREPIWDIIELLFFAYRDFVGDPDEVLAEVRLRPRASPGAAFRQPPSGHEGRRPARRPARSPSSRSAACSSNWSTRATSCRRKARSDRRQRLLYVDAEGRGAGAEARRPADRADHARASPNSARARTRRRGAFSIAMIDADNRDGRAAADRARRPRRDAELAVGRVMAATRHARRRRAASAGGRRRPPHPRSAVALSRRAKAIASPPPTMPARRAPSSTGLSFDLLILDVMMPGETGFELAKSLRDDLQRADPDADGARRRPKAASKGCEIGADDYLSQAVRAARTVAAHRQHPQAGAAGARRRRSSRCVSATSCSTSARGELRSGEDVIRLTDREREMLRVLAADAGRDRAAPGAGRQRRLGQRARRRRAGQPAAPQDRARSRQSAVRADRARHRLPAGESRHDQSHRSLRRIAASRSMSRIRRRRMRGVRSRRLAALRASGSTA